MVVRRFYDRASIKTQERRSMFKTLVCTVTEGTATALPYESIYMNTK
jgi:hypothetical protein